MQLLLPHYAILPPTVPTKHHPLGSLLRGLLRLTAHWQMDGFGSVRISSCWRLCSRQYRSYWLTRYLCGGLTVNVRCVPFF